VRIVKFTEAELPRTSTKKVKRRLVISILEKVLAKEHAAQARTQADKGDDGRAEEEGEEFENPYLLPREVAEAGSKVLVAAQKWAYFNLFDPKFTGRANVPTHTNFLVAANHTSHLDMGLVKIAGKDLVALAAADYFFDTRPKRFFMANFTHLVAMDRKGSIRKSFQVAFDLLRDGKNVLIFPEGTRSRTGQMQPFQRGLGFLVTRARKGVLPVYVDTRRALPVGTLIPRHREISARIGPYLTPEFIERLTDGLSASSGQQLVTLFVQEIVEALRDLREPDLDLEKARRRWKEEPRPAKVPVTSAGSEDEE